MFGFDKIYRNQYVQVTPKTTLLITEEMQREIDRLRRAQRWKVIRHLGWCAFTVVALVTAAVGLLVILTLAVR